MQFAPSDASEPDQVSRPTSQPKRRSRPVPPSDMLRTREACAYLAISSQTLMKLVEAGEITLYPGLHPKSPHQYSKADLDAYNKRRKVLYPKKM